MNTICSKHIVFITGCFVGSNCWDAWKEYFEAKGYTCAAPTWPHRDASPAELRRNHPDSVVASTRLSGVVDHYARIVKSLPEKPIVIGHSMGGLISQILVNHDLAAAGVAIHPAPPQGVVPLEFTFVRSLRQALGIFTSTKKPYLMPFKKWRCAVTNGMPPDEQKKAYEDYAVPESKLVARDALTGAAYVDFAKLHAPLLITAGDQDNIFPVSLNLRNFKRYKENGSILEFKAFAGRNHFVLGQPTWQEDADYILDWIDTHK